MIVSSVHKVNQAPDHAYFYSKLNLQACTHPSWREIPHSSELEMLMEIDLYLTRLVSLMRPKLLVIAVDGVAPGAKLAQQRGRRFYAAHLERQKQEIEHQARTGL
jgi:5'-3' exoribonuclease 2